MHKILPLRVNLRLVNPDLSLEREYRKMLQEMWDGPSQNGYMLPPMPDCFAEEVDKLRRESLGRNLASDRVRQTTWWCQENGERLVGMIRLRHELNKSLLQYGGNIGYIVRPLDRGRGVATNMLQLALKESAVLGLKRVLLTCDIDNEPSLRTIERNGGMLDPEPLVENQTWKRYWITLNTAVSTGLTNDSPLR